MASRNLVAVILALVLVNTKPFEEYCINNIDFKTKVNAELGEIVDNFMSSRKRLSTVGDDYSVISSSDLNSVKVLVKKVDVSSDSKMKEVVMKEIDILDKIKDSNLSPNYIGCLLYENKYVVMIQDAIDDSLLEYEINYMFSKFIISSNMLIFLKIAFLLEILHSKKKIIHNNISPLTIVSTDGNISGVRLIDFSKSYYSGTENKEYFCERYRDSALFDREKVKPNFNPDTYSFVMTMLELINPEARLHNDSDIKKKFKEEIKEPNEEQLKKLAEKQIASITDRLEVEFTREPLLKDLMDYIRDALVKNTSELTMKTLIVKLIELIEKIKPMKKIFTISTEYLEEIEKEYDIRLKGFKKLKTPNPQQEKEYI